MKSSEKQQLQSSSVADLWKKAGELKRQIIDDLLKRTHTSVKNTRFIGTMKKKLATIRTIIRQKELSEKGSAV